MLLQKDLNTWGIFFPGMLQKEANQFKDTIQKCFDQFNYKAGEPKMFEVKGRNFSDWEKLLRTNLNPNV